MRYGKPHNAKRDAKRGTLQAALGARFSAKGREFSQPRATPWVADRDRNSIGPTGQPFAGIDWPVGPKEVFSFTRSPGRCPGLGERRPLRGEQNIHHSSFIIHHPSFPLPPSPFRLPPSAFRLPPSAFPRAVTLIEMLIVLFIISLLAVAALRALPGEDQRPREAGRMLSVYISTAKNIAASTGRPTGVILRPSTTSTYVNYSTIVEMCEVPPTYSGDTLTANMLAMDWTLVPNTGGTAMVSYCTDGRPVIKLLIPANEFPDSLIRYGDQIQINGQGPVYTICWDNGSAGLYSAPPTDGGTLIAQKNSAGDPLTPPTPLVTGKTWPQEYNFPNMLDKSRYMTCLVNNPPANATVTTDGLWVNNYCVTCYLDPRNQSALPWPKANSGSFYSPLSPFSFTVIRQPVKSAVAPLQLPSGAGIDLAVSGVDNGSTFFSGTQNPIVVMFSPSGSLDSLYIGGTLWKPTQAIHLLVGKLTVSNEPDNNYADLKNILVSINPQTGTVSTNPVYPPYCSASPGPPPYPNDPPSSPSSNFDPANPPTINYSDNRFLQALFYSRKFAREAQTMGGKR